MDLVYPEDPREALGAVPAFLAGELATTMVGRSREDLVFARTVTEFSHLRVSWWRPRVFKPAVTRCQKVDADFPTVSPHELRHTAASLAISAAAKREGGPDRARTRLRRHNAGHVRRPVP